MGKNILRVIACGLALSAVSTKDCMAQNCPAGALWCPEINTCIYNGCPCTNPYCGIGEEDKKSGKNSSSAPTTPTAASKLAPTPATTNKPTVTSTTPTAAATTTTPTAAPTTPEAAATTPTAAAPTTSEAATAPAPTPDATAPTAAPASKTTVD